MKNVCSEAPIHFPRSSAFARETPHATIRVLFPVWRSTYRFCEMTSRPNFAANHLNPVGDQEAKGLDVFALSLPSRNNILLHMKTYPNQQQRRNDHNEIRTFVGVTRAMQTALSDSLLLHSRIKANSAQIVFPLPVVNEGIFVRGVQGLEHLSLDLVESLY